MKLPKELQKKQKEQTIQLHKYCSCGAVNQHFYEFDNRSLSLKYHESCPFCNTDEIIAEKPLKSKEEFTDTLILVLKQIEKDKAEGGNI